MFTITFSNMCIVTVIYTDGVALFLVPSGVLWSSGNALRLTVHSKNDKGLSERIMLQVLAYQDAERRTGIIFQCNRTFISISHYACN